jgi:hypothetical protein
VLQHGLAVLLLPLSRPFTGVLAVTRTGRPVNGPAIFHPTGSRTSLEPNAQPRRLVLAANQTAATTNSKIVGAASRRFMPSAGVESTQNATVEPAPTIVGLFLSLSSCLRPFNISRHSNTAAKFNKYPRDCNRQKHTRQYFCTTAQKTHAKPPVRPSP